MKLTAKLLKKTIREAMRKNVPSMVGQADFFADRELDPDTAQQAIELSSAFDDKIDPEGMEEHLQGYVKQYMADFVEQIDNSIAEQVGQEFIDQYSYAESEEEKKEEAQNYRKSARNLVDEIIAKSHYEPAKEFRNTLIAGAFTMSFKFGREKAKVLRSYFKTELTQAYNSYEELVNSIPDERQDVRYILEGPKVTEYFKGKIQGYNKKLSDQQNLQTVPTTTIYNGILNANSDKEITELFNKFLLSMRQLKSFLETHINFQMFRTLQTFPMKLVIDPQEIDIDDGGGYIMVAKKKAIDFLDAARKPRPTSEILQELKDYILPALASSYAKERVAPEVEPYFFKEGKFKMTDKILKKLILEELSFFLTEQESADVTLEDLDLNKRSKIGDAFLLYDNINLESGKQYLQLAGALTPVFIDIDELSNEANKVFLSGIKRHILLEIEFAYEDFYDHHEMYVSARKKKKAMEKLMIAYAKPISLVDNWDGSLEGFMEFYYSFNNTALKLSNLPYNMQLHSSGLENSDLRNYSKIFLDIFRTKDILNYAKRRFGGLRKSDKFEEAFLEAQEAIGIAIVAKGYRYIQEYFKTTPEGEPDKLRELGNTIRLPAAEAE